MLNVIICITAIALTACRGQVTSKQNSKEIIADRSATESLNKDTTEIDKTKASNVEMTKIYSRAISDFITEVYNQDVMTFDTLFFGKRNNGQPDDFPDIVLPETIKDIKIKLIDPAIGKKLQEEKKSRVYINLIGWVDKDKAKFIFVTFSNGFEHKFDCHIDYKYNSELREFDLTTSRIEILSKK